MADAPITAAVRDNRPTLSEALRLIRQRRGVVRQFDQELLAAAEKVADAIEFGNNTTPCGPAR